MLFYGIIDMFVIFHFKSDFDSHILVFVNTFFNCCGKYFNFLFINLQEAARNNNGKAAHSAWRNYDDFNEYFWFTFLKILYPGLVPRL